MNRINEHYKVSRIDGDTCGLCDDWWPCPNAIEAGYLLSSLDPDPLPRRKYMSEEDIERAENEGMSNIEPDEPVDPHREMMEMLGAIFVQLSRVYDVLMMQLPDATREQLDVMHQNGELASSPPILREDAWD